MAADFRLFYACCILIAVGMVFSLSLSTFAVLYFEHTQTYSFFVKQAISGGIGIFIIWILSLFNSDAKVIGDMTVFEFLGFMLFFGSAILMIAMYFMPSSLVPVTGGAKRWIRLGGFSVSPVEFFKIGFIFFLSWSFTRKIDNDKKLLKDEFILLLPYFVVFAMVVFVVAVLQKDFGQVVVLGFALLILATFAGTSKKLVFSVTGLGIIVLIILIISQPHRISRIQSWWARNQDLILQILPDKLASMLYISDAEEQYQITHSLNAIYHGGFFGVGLGNGTFKLGFLSEVHTDFVLAGIAEEIGLVGIIAITAIMMFIIFRILKISAKSENKVYHLFCLGIAVMIILAFLISAYGITSLAPIKGIAVPFLSYGGSSIIATCIGIGMVLMLSKKVETS